MFYHVWFSTKCRKKLLVGNIDNDINNIICECIKRHKYNVEAFATNVDHVHFLIKSKDNKELSNIIRVIKSVSSKEILKQLREKGKKIEHLWARRFMFKEYYPHEIEQIKKYINEQ